MKLSPYIIYGIAYTTAVMAIAASILMALGAWAWLVITLWSLWVVGHVVLVWYCWKITHPSQMEELEASIAREKAALLEYLRKGRAQWSPEETYQSERRVHRIGETPVVYYHPDFNVKGTLSGRAEEEIIDLEDMDRGGSE
jgi:hypothetical protein